MLSLSKHGVGFFNGLLATNPVLSPSKEGAVHRKDAGRGP